MLGPPPVEWEEPPGYRTVTKTKPPTEWEEPAGYRDPIISAIKQNRREPPPDVLATDASFTKEYIPPEKTVLSEIKTTLATIEHPTAKISIQPTLAEQRKILAESGRIGITHGEVIMPGTIVTKPPEKTTGTAILVRPVSEPDLPYVVHPAEFPGLGVKSIVDPVAAKIQEQRSLPAEMIAPPHVPWEEPAGYAPPGRKVTAGQPLPMPETLNEPPAIVYTQTAPFGTVEIAGYAREDVEAAPGTEDKIGALIGIALAYLLFV